MSDSAPSVVDTGDGIRRYANHVFTNKGQSPVKKFKEKLLRAGAVLAQVQNLVVYVGYHGDLIGNFDRNFNDEEMADVSLMAKSFPNARLVIVRGGMPGNEIHEAVKAGNVLFTWCDSDTKVRNVMADYGGLGEPIQTFV